MSEPKHTLYVRANGRGRYSGLSGTVAPGTDPTAPTATIGFAASQIGGSPPRTGDRYSDSAGQWWTVQSVGGFLNGLYPALCAKAEG